MSAPVEPQPGPDFEKVRASLSLPMDHRGHPMHHYEVLAEEHGQFIGLLTASDDIVQLLYTLESTASALLRAAESEKENYEAIDAMEAKVRALSAHETCGCSYDRPGDVCMHHSPKLAAAIAEVEALRASLARAEQDTLAWQMEAVDGREVLKHHADRARKAEAETDRLRSFVGKFIEAAREHGGTDIDGGEAQDWMLENGLLETRQVTEACGENCSCAEWDDFPQECFFVTDLGQRCLDAARLAAPQDKEGTTP